MGKDIEKIVENSYEDEYLIETKGSVITEHNEPEEVKKREKEEEIKRMNCASIVDIEVEDDEGKEEEDRCDEEREAGAV